MEEIKNKIKGLDAKDALKFYFIACGVLLVLSCAIALITVKIGGFVRGSHGITAQDANVLFIADKAVLAILYYVVAFAPLVCGVVAYLKKSINAKLTYVYGVIYVLFGIVALCSSYIGLAFGWFLCLVLIGALCYAVYLRQGVPADWVSKINGIKGKK